MSKNKKILITGPECSGKTSLSKYLAQRINGLWVPEFSRYYLSEIKRDYDINDFKIMIFGQLDLEKELAEKWNCHMCVDTSLLVFEIWLNEKYNKSLIDFGFDINHIKGFDFIFLLKPDIPWEADKLRENPVDRMRLFGLYKDKLNLLNIPFKIIEGDFDARKAEMMKALNF